LKDYSSPTIITFNNYGVYILTAVSSVSNNSNSNSINSFLVCNLSGGPNHSGAFSSIYNSPGSNKDNVISITNGNLQVYNFAGKYYDGIIGILQIVKF